MKWMLLSIFILLFVAAPMYLLNSFVLPDLMSLKQVYTHADSSAAAIAGQSNIQSTAP